MVIYGESWEYMGVFHEWGIPKFAGWFSSWNIPLKWIMTRGSPILGNSHIVFTYHQKDRTIIYNYLSRVLLWLTVPSFWCLSHSQNIIFYYHHLSSTGIFASKTCDNKTIGTFTNPWFLPWNLEENYSNKKSRAEFYAMIHASSHAQNQAQLTSSEVLGRCFNSQPQQHPSKRCPEKKKTSNPKTSDE